jgi:hypothetical protein
MQNNFGSLILRFLFFFTLILLSPALMLMPLAGADEGTPGTVSDEIAISSEYPGNCREIMAYLQERDAGLSRELKAIKREIAALSQTVKEPGLKDAVAGIGYILGLFGIAAFMASRRNKRHTEK